MRTSNMAIWASIYLMLLVLCKQTEIFATNLSISDALQLPNVELVTQDADDLAQVIEAKLHKEQQQHVQLLSRKRRYLIFPVGSSFQVVYDLIVGIVDYTNYLIWGVSVGLAWELPTKPPSEIIEELGAQSYSDTINTERNGNTSDINYATNKHVPNYINFEQNTLDTNSKRNYYSNAFQPPMHGMYQPRILHNYYKNQQRTIAAAAAAVKAPIPGWHHKYNYYYSTPRNPFYKWSKSDTGNKLEQSSTTIYPWWHLASRLSSALHKTGQHKADKKYKYRNGIREQQQHHQHLQQPVTRADIANGYHQYTSSTSSEIPHLHRVYPVFGKRSIDQNVAVHARHRRSGITGPELSKLDRIHIRYHRSTRQLLYERIEKYLDKHRQHGQHCVLRALCETGQKAHEHEPGTFVGEIMRAIFTLPEPLEDEQLAYLNAHYDQANAYTGDCSAKYHHCKHSMWQADFIK